MESGLGRAEWDAKCLSRLWERQVEPEPEHDHGTLFRLEAGERPVELVARREEVGPVRQPDVQDRFELDLGHAASTPAGEIETGVDSQSMEPGLELVRVSQTRQVAPGAHQRLLDRIAG